MSFNSLTDITTTIKTKLNGKLDSSAEAASVQWDNVTNKPKIVTSINNQTPDGNGNVSISIPGAPRAYVTETWRNGDSWYRVWNDGFVEQGGTVISPAIYSNINQNLFRHFSSNNYGLQLAICMNSLTEVSIAAYTKNNTSFMCRAFRTYEGSNNVHSVFWYAYGY